MQAAAPLRVRSPTKDMYSIKDTNLARYARPSEQPYHNRQQTNFRNVASLEIKELKDSLGYAEYLLAKSL
jgi:hypothetical protein